MARDPRPPSDPSDSCSDLSDLRFWMRTPRERAVVFAELRRAERPAYFPPFTMPFVRGGRGFYVLARHADIVAASRDPGLFSSAPSAATLHEIPAPLGRYFNSLLNMDDPRHAAFRRVVSRAFTPRRLELIDERIRRAAAELAEQVAARRGGDFATEVAGRLPVRVICDMMDVPAEHHDRAMARTNVIVGNIDAEYAGVRPALDGLSMARGLLRVLRAGHDLRRLVVGLARQRRRAPGDDVISALVTADVGGERLSAREVGQFFNLLMVAGSETTGNAIAYGLKLVTDHPRQRALLLSDYERYAPGAVEEIIRYVSPVMLMRRTLTAGHELGGRRLRKGDKVALLYASGNRDERVFDDPDAFDITRTEGPHLGFGGPGPHFCLGAHLARREIIIMFRELFARAPHIRSVGEPDRLTSVCSTASSTCATRPVHPRGADGPAPSGPPACAR